MKPDFWPLRDLSPCGVLRKGFSGKTNKKRLLLKECNLQCLLEEGILLGGG